jgi:hypothetical protein
LVQARIDTVADFQGDWIMWNRNRFMRAAGRAAAVACIVGSGAGPLALAHTPNVDSALTDWCVGATSNTAQGTPGRTENSAVQLSCGNCSVATNRACEVNADCPVGQTCVNIGDKTEVAWWDNRTDGAVNDLGTVVMTQNATNLYIGAELWVDPDPVSLPLGMIAIDFAPGGLTEWHDPNGLLKAPGRCSVFTDRGCTSNADCSFCNVSDEATGGCSITTTKACVTNPQCPAGETCVHRLRTCGSACDVGDTCNTSQTCVGLGANPRNTTIGFHASPEGKADFLLVFDFSLWLVGAGDAVQLMRPRTPADPVDPTTPWINVTGCTPDNATDTTDCDFPPAVNPGASGGSGGPPGSVEVAVPWSAFAGTGFGPGVPFRFTMTIVRGSLTLDFKPDGAHEDVLSETVAGATSSTENACPGMGLNTTLCELADGTDGFLPRTPALAHEGAPGGRVNNLSVNKLGASLVLNWFGSCSVADNNYEVYEGAIGGNFTSHVPVNCATGGTTSTFAPAAGNRYYLVVPTNGATEGSYGKNKAGVERPASTAACAPQTVGTCP